MTQSVIVNKPQFYALLDSDVMSFALYMTSGTATANALNFLYSGLTVLDLTGSFMQSHLLPTLVAGGHISATTATRIANYITASIGS